MKSIKVTEQFQIGTVTAILIAKSILSKIVYLYGRLFRSHFTKYLKVSPNK